MARRFLSLASILKKGRLSDFFNPRPFAISTAKAGLLLNCRKRSMLSGLRLEELGMSLAPFLEAQGFPSVIVDTFLVLPELFSDFRDYMSRPTHEPASRPPSD